MFTTVWEYRVVRGREHDFEALYGPLGGWVELFRRADGFIETRLLRDTADPLVYATFDRWDSAEAYRRFRSSFDGEYARIDEAASALTSAERHLGSFET